MNRSTSALDIPIGADTCTSPFFTMRIDSRRVRLYVTCIAITICKDTKYLFIIRDFRK
jgi:hypothetical protein